jgi:inosine-uridine nucleoside N-ribohydrolase
MKERRTPVILDTDIGTDIDDTWALAMLLRCPELEPRLVLTATGDTTYRARLAGAILSAGGRGDVPIGIGPPTSLPAHLPPEMHGQPQASLAKQYRLAEHVGRVRDDGVQALVDCIMESPRPVTLVAIGPLTNVAAALALEPAIVENSRLVAMMGSVYRGMLDDPNPLPEYNVVADIPACRAALGAEWEVTITPLDSCGAVVLDGARFRQLREARDPLIEIILGTYEEWERNALKGDFFDEDGYGRGMSAERSTVLFDTVAVYLAYSEALLDIEVLNIAIADDGATKIEEGAPPVRVATECALEGFHDHLTSRLLGGPHPR